MSRITTHILDTAGGKPASGVAVSLEKRNDATGWQQFAHGISDANGRLTDLLTSATEFAAGDYRLTFEVDAYFKKQGVRCFFPLVTIAFVVRDTTQHYHVPLLISPFGYSTYRGS